MAKTNNSTSTPEQSAGPIVKARILVSCAYGEPNDVVELGVDLAASLVGTVDTDPAAVDYAVSLKA
ncbi:hypothetical protein AKG95_17955 [Janthinobacterium lividum]|uniref:Uncharacterized protein n=1 Tax=Janthinobacterium lividum TaxID=29581 RepID=A0A1S1U977_9BURK|nr:hypothetical protein [Janthinobacterium lividum]OHV96599.1 hypothetical protein AKG95_17955 [Janthinobacterium lividum]